MLSKFYPIHNLASLLTRDTVVLAPNQRLASALKEGLRENHGTIYSFEEWLTHQWEILKQREKNPQKVLSTFQEQWLWKEIIAQSQVGEYLLDLWQMAYLASNAKRQCHLWQLAIEPTNWPYKEDTQAFELWHQAFKNKCEAHHWVTFAEMAEKILDAYKNNILQKSPEVILVEYNEIPPLYQSLLNTAFHHQKNHQSEQQKNHCHRAGFPSGQKELEAAIQWSYHTHQNSPNERIGIIVPNLSEYRSEIETLIYNVLPEAKEISFNISIGTPLSEIPIVEAALQVLSFCNEPKTSLSVLKLIHSPFIFHLDYNNPQLINEIADLEYQLSEMGDKKLNHEAILEIVKPSGHNHWHDSLKSAIELFQEYPPKKQTLKEWHLVFTKILEHFNWPGLRARTDIENKQYTQWKECFEQWSNLSSEYERLSYNDAVNHLTQWVHHQIFHPVTPKINNPIQIMGLLEAAGLQFDKLWLIGMNSQQWPPAAKPNPFLPYRLQRHYQMPHSSAEREFVYAQQLTQRYLTSANEIMISYSASDEEESAKPSSLIIDIPEIKANDLAFSKKYNPIQNQTRPITKSTIDSEEFGPKVSESEKNTLRGGSGILTHQAACPFRSFALYRLHADPLPESTLGIHPIDRGILLHSVLEKLWKKIKSSENLHLLSEQQTQSLITQTIKKSIKEKIFSHYEPVYLELEALRLQNLIGHWLEIEKKRDAFTLFACELTQEVQIDDLKFRLRIDRIDQLPDGSLILIDYKSGKNLSQKQWLDERIDEPQIPLYALSQNNVSGLLYAVINKESMRFKGIILKDIGITDATLWESLDKSLWPESFAQLKKQWEKNLNKLAKEFLSGYAAVDPKYGHATCNNCHLNTLCRYDYAN